MKTKSSHGAHLRKFNRRELLPGNAAAAALGAPGWPESVAAQPADGWNQGQLAHLIPIANHEGFLIKAPLKGSPRLAVNGKPVEGVLTDTPGRFRGIDAPSLRPATQYELRIIDVAPENSTFTMFRWSSQRIHCRTKLRNEDTTAECTLINDVPAGTSAAS